MTYPTVLTVIFASFLCSTAADKGLHLKGYSEGGVEGCYEHSQELAVCFDVKKDSMLIKKASGEGIVHYQELGPDMFLYQVLDDAFVGRGSAIFYVPDDVPKTPEALRSFLRDISDDETLEHETLKNHYQAAMSELHYLPEIQLLELVSAALADNSTRLELLQPFHAMCFNLFKATGVKVKDEFRAAHDMGDETADQHYREKRCSRPKANTCRGMCGLGCWCWSWFCGDCCLHRGCYEHDICCNYGRLTSYCATPFRYGFTCSKFGGYPRCKKRKSWWG